MLLNFWLIFRWYSYKRFLKRCLFVNFVFIAFTLSRLLGEFYTIVISLLLNPSKIITIIKVLWFSLFCCWYLIFRKYQIQGNIPMNEGCSTIHVSNKTLIDALFVWMVLLHAICAVIYQLSIELKSQRYNMTKILLLRLTFIIKFYFITDHIRIHFHVTIGPYFSSVYLTKLFYMWKSWLIFMRHSQTDNTCQGQSDERP